MRGPRRLLAACPQEARGETQGPDRREEGSGAWLFTGGGGGGQASDGPRPSVERALVPHLYSLTECHGADRRGSGGGSATLQQTVDRLADPSHHQQGGCWDAVPSASTAPSADATPGAGHPVSWRAACNLGSDLSPCDTEKQFPAAILPVASRPACEPAEVTIMDPVARPEVYILYRVCDV